MMPLMSETRWGWMAVLVVVLCWGRVSFAEENKDKPKPKAPTPDFTEHYGENERQILYFWKAEGEGPRPLFVLIHGGGWIHGDGLEEADRASRQMMPLMLNHGISVASISYRLTHPGTLPDPVYDAARAIQYLRYKADHFGIDKTKIIAQGGSAGGCTTLWLATHDDLADPDSDDPVARESTRLTGAWADSAQTTIDPPVVREKVTPEALKHMMIPWAAGFKGTTDMDEKYESAKALYQEFSPVNHLDKTDPPILLCYAGSLDQVGNGIHHARFGAFFKEEADKRGATCYLRLRNPEDQKMYPGAPDPYEFVFNLFGINK